VQGPVEKLGVRAAACALIVWVIAVAAAAQPPPPPCFDWRPPQSPDNELAKGFAKELFMSASFRLGSDVYATGTAEGFPIRFLPDGTVDTENFRPGARWWVETNSALHIESPDGALAGTFRYSERCHTLLHELRTQEGSYTVEIRLVK
jgi:hypothetical protein